MGLEHLTLLLRAAGSVNQLRKTLLDTTAEQSARALAAVSSATAERLFREACSLPPHEQEVTLHQVALLLEVATTVDGHASRRTRSLPPWGRGIPAAQAEFERLLWLAAIYRILGHHDKAVHRLHQAKQQLAELRNLMTEHVAGLNSYARNPAFGHDPGMWREQATSTRIDHDNTLAQLEQACTALEAMSSSPEMAAPAR